MSSACRRRDPVSPRWQSWLHWNGPILEQQSSQVSVGHHLKLLVDNGWVYWRFRWHHRMHSMSATQISSLFPWKPDTTSQPVKAWKNRIPPTFSSPIEDTTLWTGIHRVLAPWPNAINKFSSPRSCKDGMVATAITMTSASFALMIMDFLPCDVASLACTNTLVSAFSRHPGISLCCWWHYLWWHYLPLSRWSCLLCQHYTFYLWGN